MAGPLQVTIYPQGDPRNEPEANPFARFAQAPIERPAPIVRPGEERRRRGGGGSRQQAPAPAENPFARFAAPEVAAPIAAMPETAPEPQAPRIDWNMPEADIRAALKVLPAKERQALTKEWASRRVKAERAKTGDTQTYWDLGRNFVRGTPIGSWLDEGKAYLSPGDYEENLALERARNQAADDNATKLGTVNIPFVGPTDITTGTAAKLAGALTTAPFSPAIRVMQGATMIPRMANAATTGIAYGTAYGAGEGEDMASRAQNAAVGGVVGGGIGAAAAPVAAGVSNVYQGTRNAINRMPAQLRPYGSGAVSRVARAATDDGILQPRPGGFPSIYQQEAQRLGHEGMLADMGGNLRSQAGAIANMPGGGQARVMRALERRREGAPIRIERDMDRALGQPVNVPETVERIRRGANARAKPLYDQFYNSRVPISPELGKILEAAKTTGAVNKARDLMLADRVDPKNVPLPQLLDYIKRGIDDLANAAPRGSNEQRIFGNLARDLRNEVDRALSPNNPAQSVWAQARRASGEGIQFDEAVEAGRGIYNRNLTPEQMAVDLRRMPPAQRDAYRVGAREAARSVMGNAGTAFGPNGDTAARRVLQTQFGANKTRMIAQSRQAADDLKRRLGAETTFAETENVALRNSATAGRQAAQREFPNAADRNVTEGARTTLPGIVVEGVRRLANLIGGGTLNERRARIAENAAEMLVAQGMTRDIIARELLRYVSSRQLSARQAQAITTFATRLLGGTRQPAIEQTSQAQTAP